MSSSLDQPSVTSVRRRVALALAVLLLAPPVLFALVLRPIERDRTRYAREADRLKAALAHYNDRYRDVSLEVLLDRERAATERLRTDRERIESRARTLREGMTLSDVLTTGVEGRIDFKVTLFEARDRLGRLAAEKGVRLPADLGISETIASAEQAQMRLWQLAATVLLIERVMEMGIREITHIEALDPLDIPAASEDRHGVTVYPVYIRFVASYFRFIELLRGLGDPRGFFALRSFWLRFPTPETPGALDGRIVALALRVTPPPEVAALTDAEDVVWAAELYEEAPPPHGEPEEDRP